MFAALIVLNIFNVIELHVQYDRHFNAAYECTFHEALSEFEARCVVYFELMGANTSVFLSMLFIHTAVSARPPAPTGTVRTDEDEKKKAELMRRLRSSRSSSQSKDCDSPSIRPKFCCLPPNFGKQLSIVEHKLSASARDDGKQFGASRKSSLEYLIGLAAKSESENNGVNIYYKYAIDVIREVRESEAPNEMPNGFFKVEICGKPFYPPTTKWWGVVLLNIVFVACLTLISLFTHTEAYLDQLTSHSYFVVCYIFVGRFLFMHCTVMRRVTMMLQKAYALMKISANPLRFIDNQFGIADMIGSQQEHQYLNQRMRIVTPDFLRAWWLLRNHIQEWELRYFYEVCAHRVLYFIISLFLGINLFLMYSVYL